MKRQLVAACVLLLIFGGVLPAIGQDQEAGLGYEEEQYTVIVVKQGPKWKPFGTDEAMAAMQTLLKNSRELFAEGIWIAGGLVQDGTEVELIILLRIEKRSEAIKLINQAPNVKSGFYKADVYPWTAPKGLAPAPPRKGSEDNKAAGRFDMEMYHVFIVKQGPKWKPEGTAESTEVQRRLIANAKELLKKDIWIAGGPVQDVSEVEGIIIMRIEAMHEALEMVRQAPSVKSGFYKVDAYPCLSWFELLNQGSTGVCESDLQSATTCLLLRFLTGRPGYVSDPVVDTSTDEVIYAHCVATNRVFGPEGKANKYIIRSHAEDRKGASVQSLMPVGEPVTTLRLCADEGQVVLHSGVTTRNIDEAKACRTKIAARTDARQLLRNWTQGWHRVTVYGDCRKDILNLSQLLGLSVIEEDKRQA